EGPVSASAGVDIVPGRLPPSMAVAKLESPTPATARRRRNSRLPMRRVAKARALSAMYSFRSLSLILPLLIVLPSQAAPCRSENTRFAEIHHEASCHLPHGRERRRADMAEPPAAGAREVGQPVRDPARQAGRRCLAGGPRDRPRVCQERRVSGEGREPRLPA